MDSTESSQLSLLSTIESLRTGKVTSADLVGAALARIDQVNGPAPSFDGTEGAINAWVRLYPERARAAAQEADMRLAQEGDDAPLLCGVPIGIKDLYAVEGLPLTASSAVLEGNIADESSALTRHLETQGAVVIGHTHTHEFAAGGSTDQVGNPWDLSRSAGDPAAAQLRR
ncbi:amidase family protein [Nesterenkonia pannonica]|uniref:amidase family protein n=1 Tax=Nesterenkonia pannonica TaxID=1548602 RepID=UPI0021640EDF|nr:amidase family protein [Nesterenkonia pannonica]